MKPYEQALDVFRQELKMAILNEEIPMTFKPDMIDGYFAEIEFTLKNGKYRIAVGERIVCYLDPTIRDLFEDKADFEALKALARKHVKVLTPEDKAQIAELQAEIDKIKGSK